jgi:hypothetical protein
MIGGADRVRGAATRSVLMHAAEDVPLGVLDAMIAWCEAGALVDASGSRDYGVALSGCRAPLWLATGLGDASCPPERATPLSDLWGGQVTAVRWDGQRNHLEAILPIDARDAVDHTQALVRWLDTHRGAAWLSRRDTVR